MSNPRRFELVEGSSSKFWQISVDGAAFTVTYGRIGTAGTSKMTACASPAEAKAEADKLVKEKVKKGYQEPGAVADNFRPPAHIGTDEHVERFLNYKVAGFDPDADGEDEGEDGRKAFPKLRELDRRAFAVGISYDDGDEAFDARLDALFADEKIGQLRALVIGGWFSETCEDGPASLGKKLIANGAKLTSLQGLFVGDIVAEECEISWLHQIDYGPVLAALPSLRELVVRGGDELRFKKLAHEGLRALTVQSGGLAKETVKDIVDADLPELRQLTLWLGVENYGGTSTVGDLEPLLSGKRFPKLEHLGLQNSEQADEIAAAVAKSPLLGRLKGLDLSMGTLSDVGAKALLAAPALNGLKHLNVRHHYLSPAIVKELKSRGFEVEAGDRQTGDGEDRYAEVTE
jgi:predicted DNA-binding WGR domain protein